MGFTNQAMHIWSYVYLYIYAWLGYRHMYTERERKIVSCWFYFDLGLKPLFCGGLDRPRVCCRHLQHISCDSTPKRMTHFNVGRASRPSDVGSHITDGGEHHDLLLLSLGGLVVGLAASSNDLSLVCCKCWHRQPTLVWGRSCFQFAPRTACVIRSQTTTKESQLSGTLAVFVGSHAGIHWISLAWAMCVVLVCGADIARALVFKALALLLPPPAKKNMHQK